MSVVARRECHAQALSVAGCARRCWIGAAGAGLR